MTQKEQPSDKQPTLVREAQMLTREVVAAPFRLRTYRLIRRILIGFILVSLANVIFSSFFLLASFICLIINWLDSYQKS